MRRRMLGGASRKGYGAQQQALLEEDAARRLRFSGVAGQAEDSSNNRGSMDRSDGQTDRDSLGGGTSCEWRSSLDGSETCSMASLDDDRSLASLDDGAR